MFHCYNLTNEIVSGPVLCEYITHLYPVAAVYLQRAILIRIVVNKVHMHAGMKQAIIFYNDGVCK